jgi:hypothetical protein
MKGVEVASIYNSRAEVDHSIQEEAEEFSQFRGSTKSDKQCGAFLRCEGRTSGRTPGRRSGARSSRDGGWRKLGDVGDWIFARGVDSL